MNNGAAFGFRNPAHFLEGDCDVVHQHHLSSKLANALDAEGVGFAVHEHFSARVQLSCCISCGDGVVSGTAGGHSLSPLGFTQQEQVVHRSTSLEAAGALQELELELERGRPQFA